MIEIRIKLEVLKLYISPQRRKEVMGLTVNSFSRGFRETHILLQRLVIFFNFPSFTVDCCNLLVRDCQVASDQIENTNTVIFVYENLLNQRQRKLNSSVEVSPTLISNVTDEVIEEVKQWQNRPLDTVYPIVFLDCLVIKVRDNGRVINKSLYFALGVDMDG